MAAQAHRLIAEMILPGVATIEIDAAVETFLRDHRATPSFKGYRGFPAATSICVNDEMVHGVPGTRTLQNGDLVTVDIGIYRLGYHVELAQTYGVGTISEEAARLIECAKQALQAGVEAARAGNSVSTIGNAIYEHVKADGFTLAEGFGGHGIGKRLHEAPLITMTSEMILQAGMTLAIEPIVCAGNGRNKRQGWTAISEDGSLSAHVEQTIAVMSEGGAEILTVMA